MMAASMQIETQEPPVLSLATSADGEECMPGVETNLGELLLSAAHATPDAICVETQTGCWSFAQVAQMAQAIRPVLRQSLNQVVQDTSEAVSQPLPHLRRPDEHVVTIVLDRGVEAIAAVHAVMLEGCAYNAFDVGEPRDKLKSWIEVARPPVMISSVEVLERLGLTEEGWSGSPYPKLILDVNVSLRKAQDSARPIPELAKRPEDLDRLAYVIFTSGSTGKPKAVMIRHKSALNVVRIWGKYVGLGPQDRFAQVASMSWDVHIIEVYGTMAGRAASITCPDVTKKSGPDMLQWMKQKRITGMSVVPSHLRTISGSGADVSRSPHGLPNLRILDVGGEALGTDVVEKWAVGRRLFNSYGPSEISVVCTGADIQPGDEITIGYDLPSYHCYILDPESLEERPQGERGVLFVGGIGLARGYLEEEEKTNAKFVQVPGLGRLYNTGDLASRDGIGRIHYHGRVDWQVKVRGIRIELEALEQAIMEMSGVKHCEARVLDNGQKLVLIASGSEELTESDLKAKAASLGRGYVLSMAVIVENSAWKFNTSGKLLRNAVPLDMAEEAGADKKTGFEAFDKSDASELETEIACCLGPQVNADAWNRNSHFMEDLGIDSGGFGRLITELRARPKLRKVDLMMLFEHSSVAALANFVLQQAQRGDSESESDGEEVEAALGTMIGTPDGGSLANSFFSSLASAPHALCLEEAGRSLSYAQVFQIALALQKQLRRSLRRKRRQQAAPVAVTVVALAMEEPVSLLAGSLAALMEGCAFCILNAFASDLKERASLAQPVVVLADKQSPSWPKLTELCASAWPDESTSRLVDISDFESLMSQPLQQRPSLAPPGSLCCITFKTNVESGDLKAVMVEHNQAIQAINLWRKNSSASSLDRMMLSLPVGEAAGLVVSWAVMAAGGTLLLPERSATKWNWLSNRRVTMLGCSMTQLQALAGERRLAASLRYVWALDAEKSDIAPPQLRSRNPSLATVVAHESRESHGWAPVALKPEQPRASRNISTASAASTGLARGWTTISSLGKYVVGAGKEDSKSYDWGEGSWPKLCASVQGVAILLQPLLVACRLIVAERLLLPLAFALPLWQSLVLLLMLLMAEQVLRVFILIATKWILVGRYKAGDHAIYSLPYLRHWLVQTLANGTIVGQAAHQGTFIGVIFLRNLVLKALGADVALSAVITAKVHAYDLISVGNLATVHGPRHLTAVNYGTRRMVLAPIEVGAGAYVGANCVLEPGSKVTPGTFVEPLSTVPAGVVADGRLTGVPGRSVGPLDQSRIPLPGAGRAFVCRVIPFAFGYWAMMLPKALMPMISIVVLKLMVGENVVSGDQYVDQAFAKGDIDYLPPQLFQNLFWMLPLSFAVSPLNTLMTFTMTVLANRLLPKIRPPAEYSIASIRAQIAALKMSMMLQSVEMLADASIVPWFTRMCGAKIGRGCAMGLQVSLPETLEVGDNCFFATGNNLSSVDVDQGRFRVPCVTVMEDRTFIGNHNHLPQGLTEGSFAGVGTWLPEKPKEPNFSYFGNPAMKFRRLNAETKGTKPRVGPEKGNCLAVFWHHFSTSIMDVFLFRSIQATMMVLPMVLGRWIYPDVDAAIDVFGLICIFLACSLGAWYVFSVLLGNLLFNGNAPASNAYYSTTVTRWFTALTAQQRVFKLPFQTAGSRWQAPVMRLLGAKVGKNFFSMNELLLVDAPFTIVGDDVTVDYDGQIRCHSFEDFRLKFTNFTVADGVSIMAGASVAMCNAGEGAVLRPGSVTWKGTDLEPRTTYEGAPAVPLGDIENGGALPVVQPPAGPGPTLLGRRNVTAERAK